MRQPRRTEKKASRIRDEIGNGRFCVRVVERSYIPPKSSSRKKKRKNGHATGERRKTAKVRDSYSKHPLG